MGKLSETLAEAAPGWGAKVAYGEKTTLNGQDFVPVAWVAFGFGGGEGSGDTQEGTSVPAGHGEGSGGGGGGFSVPLGAYVGSPEGTKFLVNPIPLLIVAAPVVTAIAFGLAAIVGAGRFRIQL
ncbi:hypothetical protein [Agromyces seonyuensis]|uniref:Sporulation protein n=1 Tax=Agromyces seonyuensis TaxID=2662446 RepID=A0A6I4NSH2_9MICO|nr:hypothetical protein [Agromyces seonyuensis]MWB97396.1 hypothetical protein [Agromyces seonyuensis]